MEEKQEKQTKIPLSKPLEEKIAEVFIGIGYGITAIMFFVAFWIPAIALLTMEYRWLLK